MTVTSRENNPKIGFFFSLKEFFTILKLHFFNRLKHKSVTKNIYLCSLTSWWLLLFVLCLFVYEYSNLFKVCFKKWRTFTIKFFFHFLFFTLYYMKGLRFYCNTGYRSHFACSSPISSSFETRGVVGWVVRGTPSLATSSIHLFTTVNLVLRCGSKTKALPPNVFHLFWYYSFVQCNCHSYVLFTNKACQCGQIAHCSRQQIFLWLHYTIIKINEHVNSDLFTQRGVVSRHVGVRQCSFFLSSDEWISSSAV
jgi:hypothetical protein